MIFATTPTPDWRQLARFWPRAHGIVLRQKQSTGVQADLSGACLHFLRQWLIVLSLPIGGVIVAVG